MDAPRQLTISDDEICQLAHAIGERQRVTAKEAVCLALKAYRPPAPMEDRDRARQMAELDQMVDRMSKQARPGTHESDDAALYDENGLPR